MSDITIEEANRLIESLYDHDFVIGVYFCKSCHHIVCTEESLSEKPLSLINHDCSIDDEEKRFKLINNAEVLELEYFKKKLSSSSAVELATVNRPVIGSNPV